MTPLIPHYYEAAAMLGVPVALLTLLLVAAWPKPVDVVADFCARVVRRWM